MKQPAEPLRAYIETEILPRYETFDKAHRTDHARAVIDRSLCLACNYDVNTDMVYAIAAYHDLGLAVERERHHLISGEMLIGDERLRRWFSDEQLALMRDAVEDHRASAERAPRSIYGCIVAEADRMIDPETILRRTVQYSMTHYPTLDREGHYIRMCKHLEDKYAEDGYLRIWLPESDNTARLESLRQVIRDPKLLRELFDRLYDTECC